MAALMAQLHQDVNFLQPFINNNTPFAAQQKAALGDLLRRSAQLGGRRGGPTKQNLLDLAPLLPGNANFQQADNKAAIIAGLLQMVARLPDAPNQPAQPQNAHAGAAGQVGHNM